MRLHRLPGNAGSHNRRIFSGISTQSRIQPASAQGYSPQTALCWRASSTGQCTVKRVTVSYEKAGTEDGYQIVNHELIPGFGHENKVSVKAALAGLDPETGLSGEDADII